MKKTISVFYIGQDDLIELLATSICSVCHNTKSFVNFYVLDCGIGKLNKQYIENLKCKFDNFDINYLPVDLKIFDGLKKYKGFSDFWAKLLIPELAPNIQKAIYLDTDTVVLDDISLLWNQNLDQYALGAVPATYYDKWRDDAFKVYPKTNKWLFINTGMLVIDCKKWREQSITENILKLCKKYNSVLDVAVGYDEAIVSLYFEGNFKVLDCRFNMTDHENHLIEFNPFYTNNLIENEWKNIVVRHYAGSDKPWVCLRNDYDGNILKNYNAFWFYASMTPFINGLYQRFKENLLKNTQQIRNTNTYAQVDKIKIKYSLFDFIPILTIKKNNLKTSYKLFNFLPFLKITTENRTKRYKLFGFIPLLKIKEK